MKKLVAAGCSFTYGTNLPMPCADSWPAVLARRLDMTVTNLGTPAAGNQFITKQIVEHEAKHGLEDTLVIIAWSHWHRVDFCDPFGTVHHMVPNARGNGAFAEAIFTEYYNEDYLYQRYLTTVIMMQNFLEHKNVPYLMFDALNGLHDGEYMASALELSRRVNTDTFLGFRRANFDSWTDPKDRLSCGHPNVRAHSQMADILHEAVLNIL